MAHKKAGGSSRNGRDSNPKMLGMKAYGGERIRAGAIIMRTALDAGVAAFAVHEGLQGLVEGTVANLEQATLGRIETLTDPALLEQLRTLGYVR